MGGSSTVVPLRIYVVGFPAAIVVLGLDRYYRANSVAAVGLAVFGCRVLLHAPFMAAVHSCTCFPGVVYRHLCLLWLVCSVTRASLLQRMLPAPLG